MRKALIFLIVAVLAAGCTQQTHSQTGGSSQPTVGAQQEIETNSVTIKNFAFDPPAIRVSAGTTVTWTNEDSASHTIKSDANLFSSGTLNKGESFTFTFTDPGTYTYACGIHPSMKGKVVVS